MDVNTKVPCIHHPRARRRWRMRHVDGRQQYKVFCSSCLIHGSTFQPSRAEAIDAWTVYQITQQMEGVKPNHIRLGPPR